MYRFNVRGKLIVRGLMPNFRLLAWSFLALFLPLSIPVITVCELTKPHTPRIIVDHGSHVILPR